MTVGNINDVWTMKFSLSQALPSTTTTTTGKLWQDVRYITNMWTLELSRYQIYIILWRKEITSYISYITFNFYTVFVSLHAIIVKMQYYHLLLYVGQGTQRKYFRGSRLYPQYQYFIIIIIIFAVHIYLTDTSGHIFSFSTSHTLLQAT